MSNRSFVVSIARMGLRSGYLPDRVAATVGIG